MERNSILVICLCALIAFCEACTTDSELSTELKTYTAPIVLEGVIQRTDGSTNSVTARVKKSFKTEETLDEVIDISGFGTDEPCIINADELQNDETYILFIRKDADGSYAVESNPVLSSKDVTRAVRKIACDGCAQPPSIKKKLKDKTVLEGGKFTLKCAAQGLPNPTVSWTKDGETVSKGVKNNKKGSRLKVKKARKGRDDGVYTCIADNGVEQVSSSAVINICDLTCENNGDLNLKKCSCSCKDGWKGERCEQEVSRCEKTCINGNLDKTECQCNCHDGYSGDTCEVLLCPKVCGSHGTLDVKNCSCTCDEGWSGELCEINSHLSPCKTSRYCLNGGTCYEVRDIGEMICQCKENFMGPRCQYPKPVDKSPDPTNPNCDFCLNGARCVFFEGVDEIVCNCPAPFTGNRCQFKDPNTVYRMMQSAKDLHTKRILTIVGVFVALLVLIIICIVAWCKARKGKKKWEKRQKEAEEKERQEMEAAKEEEEEEEKLIRRLGSQSNGNVRQDGSDIPLQQMEPKDEDERQGLENETSFTCPPSFNSFPAHQRPNETTYHGNNSPHQSLGSYHSSSSHKNSPQRNGHSHHGSPPNSLSTQQKNTNNNKSPPVQKMPFSLDAFKDIYQPDNFDKHPAERMQRNREASTPTVQETDSDLEDDFPRFPVAETEEEDSNMDDAYIYCRRQPQEPFPEDAFKRPTLDSFEVQSNEASLLEAEDGSIYTNEDTTIADSDSESSSSGNSSSTDENGHRNFQDPRLLALQNQNSDKDSGDYAWDDEEFSPVHTSPLRFMVANPYADQGSPVRRPHQRTAPAVNHFASNPLHMNPNNRMLQSSSQGHEQFSEDNGNAETQTDGDEYTSKLRDIIENQNSLNI